MSRPGLEIVKGPMSSPGSRLGKGAPLEEQSQRTGGRGGLRAAESIQHPLPRTHSPQLPRVPLQEPVDSVRQFRLCSCRF